MTKGRTIYFKETFISAHGFNDLRPMTFVPQGRAIYVIARSVSEASYVVEDRKQRDRGRDEGSVVIFTGIFLVTYFLNHPKIPSCNDPILETIH